jgi:hypothetical protein
MPCNLTLLVHGRVGLLPTSLIHITTVRDTDQQTYSIILIFGSSVKIQSNLYSTIHVHCLTVQKPRNQVEPGQHTQFLENRDFLKWKHHQFLTFNPFRTEYFFIIALFRPEYISSTTMSTDIKFSTANFKAKHSCKVLTLMEIVLAFFMYFLKMFGLKSLVTPSFWSGGHYWKCAELMKKNVFLFCFAQIFYA